MMGPDLPTPANLRRLAEIYRAEPMGSCFAAAAERVHQLELALSEIAGMVHPGTGGTQGAIRRAALEALIGGPIPPPPAKDQP